MNFYLFVSALLFLSLSLFVFLFLFIPDQCQEGSAGQDEKGDVTRSCGGGHSRPALPGSSRFS